MRLVLPILVIVTSLPLARPTTTSPSCSPTASQINCWFRAACEPDFLAGMFSARAIVIDAKRIVRHTIGEKSERCIWAITQFTESEGLWIWAEDAGSTSLKW